MPMLSNFSLSFSGKLDSGELLTGAPTVEEINSPAVLTFSNIAIYKLQAEGKKFNGAGHFFCCCPNTIPVNYVLSLEDDVVPSPGFLGKMVAHMSNDSSIGIDWSLDEKDVLLSERDKKNPTFQDAYLFNIATKLY